MARLQLESFQINGVKEFWSLPDVADQCLDEAYALVKVFESAYDTAASLHDNRADQEPTVNDLNDRIKARAMEGIARLIAMAQYCHDANYMKEAA